MGSGIRCTGAVACITCRVEMLSGIGGCWHVEARAVVDNERTVQHGLGGWAGEG